MITGPRAAVEAVLDALPGVRLAWSGAPSVDEPNAFVAVADAAPDPTACAHDTTVTVLVVCQFDDPQKAGPALDTAADLILDALKDLCVFTTAEFGVYRDRAPSVLLSFSTRQ